MQPDDAENSPSLEEVLAVDVQPRKRWKVLLKAAFSVGVLAYFAYSIDLSKLLGFVKQVRWDVTFLLGGLSLIRVVIGAWRFELLLKPRKDLGLKVLTEHYFIGNFFNQLLPTALGGDAVRVLLLAKHGVPMPDGATYIFVERVLGLLSLAVISLVASWFIVLPQDPQTVIYLMGAGTLGGCVVLLGLVRFVDHQRLPLAVLRQGGRTLDELSQHPRRLLATLLASIPFQALGIIFSYLVAKAFAFDVPLGLFFAFVPVVYVATMLPISLGGVGLRELAFVKLFAFVGVSEEVSLIISLGTYLSYFIPALVGGLLYLMSSRAQHGTSISNRES